MCTTQPRICDFIDGRIKRIIPLRNSVAAAAATLVLLEADDMAQGGVMVMIFRCSFFVESAWFFKTPS